jgi:molybdate transport system substrate-binding protein
MVLGFMTATACGSTNSGSARPAADTDADADGEAILVFAAASLTDAFDALARSYVAEHPEHRVEISVAGSTTLESQILDGAPADVFAPADPAPAERVIEAGLAAGPATPFASNQLKIAVAVDREMGGELISGLDDFARDQLLLGLCASTVPCGQLADEALAEAGVAPAIDTREPDVRSLLAKVADGELDGGIVYGTDITAAEGRVVGIDLPDGAPVARYPIVVLNQGDNPDGGASFVDFVLSPAGQAVLTANGFGPARNSS